jgi:hypothetical protein
MQLINHCNLKHFLTSCNPFIEAQKRRPTQSHNLVQNTALTAQNPAPHLWCQIGAPIAPRAPPPPPGGQHQKGHPIFVIIYHLIFLLKERKKDIAPKWVLTFFVLFK